GPAESAPGAAPVPAPTQPTPTPAPGGGVTPEAPADPPASEQPGPAPEENPAPGGNPPAAEDPPAGEDPPAVEPPADGGPAPKRRADEGPAIDPGKHTGEVHTNDPLPSPPPGTVPLTMAIDGGYAGWSDTEVRERSALGAEVTRHEWAIDEPVTDQDDVMEDA